MRGTFTAAVLTLLLATPMAAQEITCADVEFDAEILADYPEVQEACLGIVEDQGIRYVHLRARVQNNWISSLTIRYQQPDETWGMLKTVTPPEGFTAIVNGRPTPVEEIREGAVMNIFVPEGRWEVAMADVDMPAMAEMTFAPVEVEEADEPAGAEGMEPEAQPTAEPDEAEAMPAGTQSMDADQPYAGISPVVWILFAALFVVILWLYRSRRRERTQG